MFTSSDLRKVADRSDDLLGCDCNMPKLTERDPNVLEGEQSHLADSDSDDESSAKFVSASQYDPGPVCCPMRFLEKDG